MGRVRPGHIKRAANELMEKYPDLFSKDFKENKEKLRELINTDSKKVINRIAGYISSNYNSKSRMRRQEPVQDK